MARRERVIRPVGVSLRKRAHMGKRGRGENLKTLDEEIIAVMPEYPRAARASSEFREHTIRQRNIVPTALVSST